MPTAFAFNDGAAYARRQRVMIESQGIFAETLPRLCCAAQTITITQTVYFMGIGLLAGDVVSNMFVAVGAGSASASLTKCGLYSSGGTLLAQSLDVTTTSTFTSAGVKTVPLVLQADGRPLTIPSDGLYYAAFLNVSAVTAANLFRGGVNLSGGGYGPIGSGAGVLGVQTGQTDLPPSATISFVATPIPYWVGLA